MNQKPRKDTIGLHCDVHVKLYKRAENTAKDRGWTLRMMVEHALEDFFTRLDGKNPLSPDHKKFVQ